MMTTPSLNEIQERELRRLMDIDEQIARLERQKAEVIAFLRSIDRDREDF